MTGPRSARTVSAERLIGRLLIGVTYISVALLIVGVALLVGGGISPISGGPSLDLGRLPSEVLRLDPSGFLWLGLLAIMAAPLSRVTIALFAYGRDRDWLMVAVSIGILLVIAVAIGSALVVTA